MWIIRYLLIISLMIVNANTLLNPCHKEVFKSFEEELIVYGGANAGKSYSIADKIVLYPAQDKKYRKKYDLKTDYKKHKLKALVIRKTLPSLKATCMEMIENSAEKFKEAYSLHKQDSNGQIANMQVLYRSLNSEAEIEKVMSITDVDIIWVEEANQITEADYEKLVTRLRGGKGFYSQIILTFNPIGKTSWIYKRFFEKNIGDAHKIKYTISDNPWATEKEKKRLQRTKSYNLNFYNIYFLGDWGELDGVIYDWPTVAFPKEVAFDEIFYGGDFGFSVDPASLTKIYRKGDSFWLEEIIYEKGLTNQKLGKKMEQYEVAYTDDTYWDSAEPKSIEELCDMGFNAKPALKGPDSVRAGIDLLLSKKIHIIEGSENIIKEKDAYVWKKDKDGNALNVPIGFNNHSMDGTRYGITTHCKYQEGWFIGESENAVY